MPLYEYECERCAHRFEVIQKFSDEPVKVCPTCGGPVHKLLSSPAIQFKGSGFYLTDYGRGTGSKPESAGTKAAKTEGSGSGGGDANGDTAAAKPSTDSKPATESKPASKAD
jgi:putative FmdB family regulatory protein